MNESKMAQEIISDSQENEGYSAFEIECHYNHYGTRGAVDLVLTYDLKNGNGIHLYELKSESALRNSTGANEIIRQLKKHRKYFFKKNSDYPKRVYDDKKFLLSFYATEHTISHVKEYMDLYRSVERGSQYRTRVVLYHEDVGSVFFAAEGSVADAYNGEQLLEVVE